MTAPIALSCGDPAGIGPEIAAKARDALHDTCPFFYIGDAAHLPPGTPVAQINDPSEVAATIATALPVLQLDFPAPNQPGHPDPANAPSVIDAIEQGVTLVQSGAASALCTAPINKKALIDGAGFAYPGHTECLAGLAGQKRVVMMLAS
ncbi:MAG: 4-hydroxythreonine-4-phosphate dehydrogenase PdxA, partial [Pseudomonadota bacterium]